MYTKLKTGTQALDGSGEHKAVFIPAGWYEVERVANPFGHEVAWLVVKGTTYGAIETFWRYCVVDEGKDWVIFTDDLPDGAALADPSKIGRAQKNDEGAPEFSVARRRMEQLELFPTELRPDSMTVAYLWRRDRHQGSMVQVVKEIWNNIGGRGNGLGDGSRYPVFHVCDGLNPCRPGSGGFVNLPKEPFLELEDALAVAKQRAEEALASGEWVVSHNPVEDEPSDKRTSRVVLEFRPDYAQQFTMLKCPACQAEWWGFPTMHRKDCTTSENENHLIHIIGPQVVEYAKRLAKSYGDDSSLPHIGVSLNEIREQFPEQVS